ncbi:glucosaminidase domain-containing protein [Staphylococcus capitis]|uniref:glucosaminidase domain-containing protein n=1 Tax=Staphylococcus TaxID=1279 RepID=UPI0022E0A112|nr:MULTISPECIES: glucosaminidase domain-containing protein [Staphylococcus]MDH9600752.1 glucosaminidase domain-containing protein [Staphylococcus capitis]MDH9624334.1 glucosaminidase domain-containing protein [Staphylococcus capitis]
MNKKQASVIKILSSVVLATSVGQVTSHVDDVKAKEVSTKGENIDMKKFKSTFEKNAKGGKLEGKSDEILKIADEEKIPRLLMAAIIVNESEWGKSESTKKLNNPMSVMDNKVKKYDTIDDGLRAGAKYLYKDYIKLGLNTPKEIEKKYAPTNDNVDPNHMNEHWASKIEKTMKKLGAKKDKASS